MKKDIVERLRYEAGDMGFGYGPILRDAADEIEKLRTLLADAYTHTHACHVCADDPDFGSDDTAFLLRRIAIVLWPENCKHS
jgi:hypothetical protein